MDPEHHIQGVLDRVQEEHLKRHYFSKDPAINAIKWDSWEEFLTRVANSCGRLLKGGEPDLNSVAKMVLNDFQRGKLPYYVVPPKAQSKS